MGQGFCMTVAPGLLDELEEVLVAVNEFYEAANGRSQTLIEKYTFSYG